MHWDSLHFISPTSSVYSLRFLISWLTIPLTPPKTRIIDKFKRSVNAEFSDSIKSFSRFSKTCTTYLTVNPETYLFWHQLILYKPMKTILGNYDFFIKTKEKLSIVINNGWIRGETCFGTWLIWLFFIWEYNQMSSTIGFAFSSLFVNNSSPNWYFNIAYTISSVISFQRDQRTSLNVRLSCS